MAEEIKLPEWLNPGIEPPQRIKQSGWGPGEKPAAQYMNWQMHQTYQSLVYFRDSQEQMESSFSEQLAQININVAQPPYNATTGTDVTAKINQAIIDANNRGGGTVYIPKNGIQSYLIDTLTSIQMLDFVKLELAQGVVLEAITNNFGSYAIIKALDKKSISIKGNNALLKGERTTHIGDSGEWGMGIDLRGCTDVYISDINVEDCWGDGIYIGSTTNQNYCANVVLERFKLNNNRRQGISVISAKKLIIRDGEISNTNGTGPSDGIDIEPNVNTEFLQGIVIDNVTTRDNYGSGIKIFLGFYEDSLNEIDINIRNHKDFYSQHGFRVRNYIPGVKGLVKLENCIWENDKTSPFYAQRLASTGVRVEAHDCTVVWTAQTLIASSVAFMISRETTTVDNYRLGNVHLYRPNLIVKGVAPFRGIFLDPVNSECIENISIIDPVALPVADNLQLSINKVGGKIKVSDANKVLHRTLTAHTAYTNPRYKRSNDNLGATLRVNVPINRTDLDVEMRYTNLTSFGMRITPTIPIYPLSPNAIAFETSEIGASIDLKGFNDGWVVTNMTGNWTLIS